MSTAKQLMHDTGYFDSLTAKTNEIIESAMLKAANDRNGPEGYNSDQEALEAIECHSRDGFICASYNEGGLIYRNFTDLMDYFGGGYTPKHEGAAKEIERQMIRGAMKLVKRQA